MLRHNLYYREKKITRTLISKPRVSNVTAELVHALFILIEMLKTWSL